MIEATTSIDTPGVAALAAAILGTGGISALLTLRKAGREAENIAAKTLIEVNEELRRELARRDEEIESLRKKLAEVRAELVAVRRNVDDLDAQLRRALANGGH
jgi:chromosome segregation ATPase